MSILPGLIFLTIFIVAGFFLFKRIRFIQQAIALGRPTDRSDQKPERWKTMALVALGQKKMFKRPIPAFLHLLIYVAFIIINLEILEFIIDGLSGSHRVFSPYLGQLYVFSMTIFEFLALATLFACVVFLIRRFVYKVPRLSMSELNGWPKLDATLILVIEIMLMVAILTMNAADQVLAQRGVTGYTVISGLVFSAPLRPLLEGMNNTALVIIERAAWWFHIAGILAFAVYVTYSKHLHIFLAFPNTWFSNLKPKGELKNMDDVTREVQSMLGLPTATEPAAEVGRFGAKDINDLSWVNIMNAFACTECGRCTAECPANITGKKLSPRKIMMDTRDRAEEVTKSIQNGGSGLEDGKSLLGDYITAEEINACTTCNACVEACPVNIDPLAIILELRRYAAMEESNSPAQWNAMFQNIETSFSPWKFAPTDRFKWADELKDK